jgi:hypothetical protein
MSHGIHPLQGPNYGASLQRVGHGIHWTVQKFIEVKNNHCRCLAQGVSLKPAMSERHSLKKKDLVISSFHATVIATPAYLIFVSKPNVPNRVAILLLLLVPRIAKRMHRIQESRYGVIEVVHPMREVIVAVLEVAKESLHTACAIIYSHRYLKILY